MKKSSIAAAAAVTLSFLGSAYAAGPQVSGGAASSVPVTGSATYKLAPQEFDDYAYTYILDNGMKMSFSRTVGRYYTEVNGEGRTEIFGRAPGVFMTAAGTRIEFSSDGDSLAISNLEKLPMAARAATPGHLYLARR
jgi:hypothetical protein